MSRISKILAQGAIIENTLIVGNCARFLVKLDGSPIRRGDILDKNAQVRSTKGVYYIKYTPHKSYQRKELAPFVFVCDMLRFTIRITNAKMFARAASIFPEIKWVLKNTNYSPDIFKCAAQHPGMLFPFSVNWSTYCRSVTEQAGKEWNTKDYFDLYKPLVTFQTNPENWDIKIEDNECFNPYEKDYVDKLLELKKLK